jgi:small conductance mechanosensitive channel
MHNMETQKISSFFAENMSYFNKGLEKAFAWFLGNFGTFLFILFIGLITILVARNVNLLMETGFKKASVRLRMDLTAFQMFRHIMVAVIYFVGIVVVIFSIPSLSTVSVALFTGAGVVGIVIGLAAQSTLRNS